MDFIAGTLELAGKWIVGHKNKWGWLVSTVAGLSWISYVIMSKQSYGLLVVTIPAIFINLWNFYKWSEK